MVSYSAVIQDDFFNRIPRIFKFSSLKEVTIVRRVHAGEPSGYFLKDSYPPSMGGQGD
jgi:hypothetical protein